MGRSKEKGKSVDQLTPHELRQEKLRCETLIGIYRNKKLVHALESRLRQIERRLEE